MPLLVPYAVPFAIFLLLGGCGKDSPTGSTGAPVARVSVTPETTELSGAGQTIDLTVSVRDGQDHELGEATVSWRSSDVSVATVNAAGRVTAVGAGSAIITATSGQKTGQAQISVSSSVRTALTALYRATDGDQWTNRTGWLSDTPIGAWYGLSVGADSQANGLQARSSASGLTRLDLSNNQLTGKIPAALGDLSDLRYLDLSENALTGEIPAALGKLSKLETLRLNDNLLSGEIPSELGDLSSLQELSLHGNGELTGPLPLSLARLAALETLSLSGTLLCAPTDTTFQNWLEGIANKSGVDNCRDDVVLDRNALVALYNTTGGVNWKTSTKWLTDEPLESWYGIGVNTEGRVDSLVLEENDLNGTIPTSLGNLADLQVLDLSDNELSGVVPSELGNLAGLVTLDLSNNELSGEIPFAVINLPSLQTLDLSGNQFAIANLPTERAALVAFYNTTGGSNWYFSANWLSEEPLESWYGVTTNEDGSAVTGLDLNFNNLNGGLPPELGRLTSLTSLNLKGNNLSGELPRDLGSLASLITLDLSFNQFTGEIPPDIGQLTSLTGLDLSWNDLSGRLPPEMTQLVNLSQLYLHETSVCLPQTEEFQAWINRIGFSRVTYCVEGTPGSEPANQDAFDALVSGKILSAESYYLEFGAGSRFTEGGRYEGNYAYAAGDSSSGAGVLTLTFDEGVYLDSCTVELLFVQQAKGLTRYSCDGGSLREFEQWRLSDEPDPSKYDIEIIWVGQRLGGSTWRHSMQRLNAGRAS